MRGYLVIDNKFKDRFFNICFDAYWKDNINLSDEKSIKEILKKCSIDEKFFFQEIQNQKIKDKLKKLTDEAFKNDIFGAPTFVINNKIFWGQDRLSYALDEYDF